jgi:hypothetical protein
VICDCSGFPFSLVGFCGVGFVRHFYLIFGDCSSGFALVLFRLVVCCSPQRGLLFSVFCCVQLVCVGNCDLTFISDSLSSVGCSVGFCFWVHCVQLCFARLHEGCCFFCCVQLVFVGCSRLTFISDLLVSVGDCSVGFALDSLRSVVCYSPH